MEENETIHPEYQRGFNQGYELAQYASEFLETMSKIENKSERMQGLKDGWSQYTKEREARLKNWLPEDKYKVLREQNKQEREKDKGKDKGGIEKIPGE